jgi:subtilisin family serine protease
MGTMIGRGDPDKLIGMAPGAQWIGCRNMEDGWGSPATYAECYEWFVAPYPVGGDPFRDGDPLRAPHVINNSWSCTVQEGCAEPDILRGVVDNVQAAGIVSVHAAANNGPACGSLSVPPAIYDSSFAVGATNADDLIAGFSSRGPSQQDNAFLVKPDISAPGVGIYSSIPDGLYGLSSGTSMAAPHVAGLVALLVEANPRLAGDVDQLEQLIQDTAVQRMSSEGCGGDEAESVPNNVYGWGRIDAFAAFEAAVLLPTPGPTPESTITPEPTTTIEKPEFEIFLPTWFTP